MNTSNETGEPNNSPSITSFIATGSESVSGGFTSSSPRVAPPDAGAETPPPPSSPNDLDNAPLAIFSTSEVAEVCRQYSATYISADATALGDFSQADSSHRTIYLFPDNTYTSLREFLELANALLEDPFQVYWAIYPKEAASISCWNPAKPFPGGLSFSDITYTHIEYPLSLKQEIGQIAEANSALHHTVEQMALAATSAALQGKAKFRTAKHGNLKPANLFSAVIMPPSKGKSSLQEILDSPFKQAVAQAERKKQNFDKSKRPIFEENQNYARKQFKGSYSKYLQDLRLVKRDDVAEGESRLPLTNEQKKHALLHIDEDLASDAMFWAETIDDIQDELDSDFMPGVTFLANATPEALVGLSLDGKTTYLSTSEFSSMLDIINGKYDKNNRQNGAAARMTPILSAWNNEEHGEGRINHNRTGARPNTVINAMIQPNVWATTDKKAFMDVGFYQRFLFSREELREGAYSSLSTPDVLTSDYHNRLLFLITAFDNHSHSAPYILPFSEEANNLFYQLEASIHDYPGSSFGQWVAKSGYHVAKLATCYEFHLMHKRDVFEMLPDADGDTPQLYVLPTSISPEAMLLAMLFWEKAWKIAEAEFVLANGSPKSVEDITGAKTLLVEGVNLGIEEFCDWLKTTDKEPSRTHVPIRFNALKDKDKRAAFLIAAQDELYIHEVIDAGKTYYFPGPLYLDSCSLDCYSYFKISDKTTPCPVQLPDGESGDMLTLLPGNKWELMQDGESEIGKGILTLLTQLTGSNYYEAYQKYVSTVLS